jgi:mannose-1-phosphate guanylyltransferase/mannose-1-phosphate guanylyltransferase/mannose-6-phosphate isomerase
MAIQPVILSGGAGTRLWPMSRQEFPKQLLPLAGPVSMIRATLERVEKAEQFLDPMIITAEALRFTVAEEVRLGNRPAAIVLEPVARNTAPAVAAAAFLAAERDPETILLVMPSDHVITDETAFQGLVALAAAAAKDNWLVTFSMAPTRPETGYGYIKTAQALPNHSQVRKVEAFVEKPDAARAQAFIDQGDHYWNSGMFVFKAKAFLDELKQHAPQVLEFVQKSVANKTTDLDFIRLEAEAFGQTPSISVDYAVMERTDKAATIIGDIGWTDVGSWSELWSIASKDETNNVILGDVILNDTKGSYLRSEGPMIAASGIENLVIVATEDAVLVTTRDRSQDVKYLVEQLRQSGRTEHATHTQVHRPWGYYQTLHHGERFQVKRLSLKPGAKISLQKHFHRAEHWVVVNGTALVTRGEESHIIRENESIYIPLGEVHRLENPGKVPLNVIEVQSGEYLGEDDIVRYGDTYGRA